MAESKEKFVVYKSSAGSGKTFRLSVEYIRLVLQNPINYRKILGSTFTNKAAHEMKSKIISYLNDLANINPENPEEIRSSFYHTVKNETGLPDFTIREHASKALTFILHDYSDFSIMTLDKFTTRLARSYQHDLLIEHDFEIELDVDGTIKKATDDLFAIAGLNHQVTEILTSYIWESISNNQDWKPEKMIQDFSRQIQKESAIPQLNHLKTVSGDDFRELIDRTASFVNIYRNNLRKTGKDGLEIFRKYQIDPGIFLNKESGLFGQFIKLEKGMDEVNKNVVKSFQKDKWFGDQVKPEERTQAEPHLIVLKELVTSYYDRRKYQTIPGIEDYQLYISLSAIQKNIYAMALFHEINRVVEEYKDVNRIVFLSELNHRISEIVSFEQAPYIYERIGNQYQHILLDEFQDNSLLQWRNFIPLFENALSMNNLCLIVGDGKQSIYRWRNGLTEQFARLPEIHSPPDDSELWLSRQKLFRDHYKQSDLQQNFRSDKAIVEFNNELFGYLNTKHQAATGEIYNNHKQKVTRIGNGLVSIEFLDGSADTYTESTLGRILEIITGINKRKFTFRDIAILCRRNAVACEVSRFLTSHRIPVVSSESITLNSSDRVNTIISFLRLINSHDFRFYPVEITGLLMKTGIISHELFDTFFRNLSLQKSLTADYYETNFLNLLQKNDINIDINRLYYMTLYEKTEYLIKALGFHHKPDPFLIFFLQVLKEFTEKSGNLTEDFLHWWDEKGRNKSIIIPAEYNAVKVMTIHKAKGLQFPVVIYPFANDKTDLSKSSLWVQADLKMSRIRSFLIKAGKDINHSIFSEQYQQEKNNSLLDLINLLYVALTRAASKMYVLCSQSKSTDPESISGLLRGFLDETGKQPGIDDRYTFGEEELADENHEMPVKKESDTGDDLVFQSFSGDWHERVLISHKNADYFNPASGLRKAKKGKIIHEILSGWIPGWEIDDLIRQTKVNPDISTQELTFIKNMLTDIITHPELKAYYTADYEVLNETEIMLPGGKIYRPDRVMIQSDEVHLLDYKTGEKSDHHSSQLLTYARVIAEMGFRINKLLLVYLFEDGIEVVRVPL